EHHPPRHPPRREGRDPRPEVGRPLAADGDGAHRRAHDPPYPHRRLLPRDRQDAPGDGGGSGAEVMTTFVITAGILLALFAPPISAALGAPAVLGAALSHTDVPLTQAFAAALVRVFPLATSAEGSTLATIPLFTFMGYVLAESKTADRLVAFAKAAVGWLPGGLAIVTIVVCALFTTVTGASGVTIVAVGGLVMPALLKEGYRPRSALGPVTSTRSIGLLFP